MKDLVGDAHATAELEREWEQLQEDRMALRQIFPTGDNKVGCLFCSGIAHMKKFGVLHRITEQIVTSILFVRILRADRPAM